MRNFKLLSAALLSTAYIADALLYTKGSECKTYCADDDVVSISSTNTSEIVCTDDDFTDSGRGIKLKNCIECLKNSEAVHGSDTDVQALLYNVRYAFDVCLYSYPDDPVGGFINTPCNIDYACGKLDTALKKDINNPSSDSTYDYCDESKNLTADGGWKGCVNCLRTTNKQQYFANFLVTLKAGCDQRPEAGDILSVSGDIFTSTALNITDPAEDISKRPEGAGSNTITTGAIVGIVVGCALLFIGSGVLIFMYCRKVRLRDRRQIDSPSPVTPGGGLRYIGSGLSGGSSGSLPSNQKMSESLVSSKSRSDFHKRAYSTNTTAPYEPVDGQGFGLSYQHSTPSQQSSLPTHPAYIPKVMSRYSPQPLETAVQSGTPAYSHKMPPYLKAKPINVSDPSRHSHARSYSQPVRQSPLKTSSIPHIAVIPPPPPAAKKDNAKVPSLILPSLSRAKKTKTYEPPQVAPVDEETRGLAISDP